MWVSQLTCEEYQIIQGHCCSAEWQYVMLSLLGRLPCKSQRGLRFLHGIWNCIEIRYLDILAARPENIGVSFISMYKVVRFRNISGMYYSIYEKLLRIVVRWPVNPPSQRLSAAEFFFNPVLHSPRRSSMYTVSETTSNSCKI